MFTGSMIDDLINAVKRAEANQETDWMIKEEMRCVPVVMERRYETMVNTQSSVQLGVA